MVRVAGGGGGGGEQRGLFCHRKVTAVGERVTAMWITLLCRRAGRRRSPTGGDYKHFLIGLTVVLSPTMRVLPPLLSRLAPSTRLTLHSPSPLVRPLHPSPTAALAKPDDFVLYPSFLSEAEQEALVAMGLWKLGKSRGDRRARRRNTLGVGADEHRGAGLQRLFSGQYTFEEVRFLCTHTIHLE